MRGEAYLTINKSAGPISPDKVSRLEPLIKTRVLSLEQLFASLLTLHTSHKKGPAETGPSLKKRIENSSYSRTKVSMSVS